MAYSPDARVPRERCALKRAWKVTLVSSPPDGPIATGPNAFEAPPRAPAACQKWARQLQRGTRQSASKSKSCEKFGKSSKWAGLICVLGLYRGDYLQRAHKRASMETGGTCVSEAALRYRRSVRPCGIVRGRVRVCEGEMTYSPKRRFWAYLSDPRCLPRSETSESTVVTVLARSKTRTKVSWAIRPLGKILDRQVSSPRPEERDPRSAGLFPTARGRVHPRLRSVFTLQDARVPGRGLVDRTVRYEPRALPLGPEWKFLDREVSFEGPKGEFLHLQVSLPRLTSVFTLQDARVRGRGSAELHSSERGNRIGRRKRVRQTRLVGRQTCEGAEVRLWQRADRIGWRERPFAGTAETRRSGVRSARTRPQLFGGNWPSQWLVVERNRA